MTEIAQVQWALEGWPGAPGVNTFAVTKGTAVGSWSAILSAFAEELESVYVALRQNTPSGWKATATGVARIYEHTTGELVALEAYTPPDAVTSPITPGEGKANRADMIVAGYNTSDIHNGRLIRGRSFLGPIVPAAHANDGTIDGAVRNTIQAAYGGMISGVGARLAVWSRPKPGSPGGYGDVTSVICSATPGVLTRRRD